MSTAESDRRKLLAIVGVALFAAGLLFGLLPVTTTAGGYDVSCGNAWFLEYDPMRASADRITDAMYGGRGEPQGQEKCETAAGSRGTIGFILAGLGAAALLGVLLVGARRSDDGTAAAA
jgi:hypothetical protein